MTIFNHKTGRKAAKSRKAKRHQHEDVLMTTAAYASGRFIDKRKHSFINLDGHLFLYGEDMKIQHDAVMERGNWTCAKCFSRQWIEVHHVIPRGKGGSDDADNLIVLCHWCHRTRHPQVRLLAVSA